MSRILSLAPNANYIIAEYITELDYRVLILTSKIIRINFLRQEIWKKYKKYLIPFLSHFSKTLTYPTRTNFYKGVKTTIKYESEYGKVYDFCSKSWINNKINKLLIKSVHGKISNYIDKTIVVPLDECVKEENRKEIVKNANNGIKKCIIDDAYFNDFEIADGDHMGIDSSYSIAILSHWIMHRPNGYRYYKFIHIFHGNTPSNLSKYVSIPTKLFSDLIDIIYVGKDKISYSFPFLVFVDVKNKRFVVIDISKIKKVNESDENNGLYICPSGIRVYPVVQKSMDKKVSISGDNMYMNLNRGHILSWILRDKKWRKHIYSLDLTLGENAPLTHIFMSSPNNYVTGKFVHSSISKKFCCTLHKSKNLWFVCDYSDYSKDSDDQKSIKLPLKKKNLVKIQKQGTSFELSWSVVNNYSYPTFLNVTSGLKEWGLEFCSDF
jgi:hypothetical protein